MSRDKSKANWPTLMEASTSALKEADLPWMSQWMEKISSPSDLSVAI